jgi:hypothetical protein
MKLLALTALLAASVHASADADADAASSSASAPPPAASSPVADPTPVGALWTSTWDNTTLAPFTQSCASRSTHRAQLFTLASLYPDLETYAPQLKIFYNRQVYPGSWEGVDVHGVERELLKMDVVDLPKAVQEWLAREKTQRHYSVQDDVVFFAPGAIYPIAPLWVEAQEGCEGMFNLREWGG